MLRVGGTRVFEIRFPGRQTLRQVLGCKRLTGSVFRIGICGRGGEGLEGTDEKLNREAGSVETTARHTRKSEEGPAELLSAGQEGWI